MNMENSGVVNRINLLGEIASECEFSHDVFGEGFYSFKLLVPRLSDANDLLPITISERIMEGSRFSPGELIKISGQIRSYNNYIEKEGRNRLVLTVFAKDYEFCDVVGSENPNDVFLDGFICKPPIYRTTPFGREIADLLLAVNRSYNKSDYIPCITWGRNARYGAKLVVGDNIRISGRMQSRLYQKKLEDESMVEKTAYEVSVARIEIVAEE
ncbi:MAG: single-stranded DNA-binding protein [Clostridiales bacterium]|jgi:single-stranded DNA-binding protein|nr:single-stranded DNA-binding protein [Clostridiales bacterium]